MFPEVILPGVWWLHGVRGANVYAVRLADGAFALVDAGLPGSAPAILDGLHRLGAERVSHLLLTHRHLDHAGSAAALRRALGLAVVVGAGDAADGRLRGPFEETPVDVLLPARECEAAPGVLAIPAPGHTAGSTCYLLRESGLLFIGDVALHSGNRMSRPLPPANEDTPTQERSLAAIAGRAPLHGAPGHGDPVVEGFGELLRALAARPPARGPWWLRVLLNPRALARFLRRTHGGARGRVRRPDRPPR